MSEKIIKFPSSHRKNRGFFEKLGFEFYDKVSFEDEEESEKFKKSMVLYSEFLEIIHDKHDGEDVEDESIMEKLFAAIETSTYNIEARVMEINMRSVPEYEREHALLAVREEAKGFAEGDFPLEQGELNIFYLRVCEHLAQFYLDSEVYSKVFHSYDDFDTIEDFSSSIFNEVIHQRLVAAIYLNDEDEIRKLFDLAEEYDKEYHEVVLLSKVFYYLFNRNEELAFEYLEDLEEENQFTKNYIIRLFNPRLPSLFARDREEAREIRRIARAFSYYVKLLESDYFYEFLVNMSTDDYGNLESGVDLLKKMKNDPIFKGVNERDLEILCNAGFIDKVSFLDADFIDLLGHGIKIETMEKLLENGVELVSTLDRKEGDNVIDLFKKSLDNLEEYFEDVDDIEDDFDEEDDDFDEGNVKQFPISKKEKLDFASIDSNVEKVKAAWEEFNEEFGDEFSSEEEAFKMFRFSYDYGLYDEEISEDEEKGLFETVEQLIKEEQSILAQLPSLENMVYGNIDLVKKIAHINEKYYANGVNNETVRNLQQLNRDFDHDIVTLPVDIAKEFPGSHEQLIILHILGRVYYKQKLYKKAKECFTLLLAADPNDILEARHDYAIVCAVMGETDALLDTLDEYEYEVDESILLSLIICHINDNDIPKAYEAMKILKKINSHIGELFDESSSLLEETNFEKLGFALKNIEYFTFNKYYYDYLNLVYHIKKTKKENVVDVIDDDVFRFLTNRLIATLARHNITSKEDLEKYSEKELLSLKGIGEKTVAILKRNGVEFKK